MPAFFKKEIPIDLSQLAAWGPVTSEQRRDTEGGGISKRPETP